MNKLPIYIPSCNRWAELPSGTIRDLPFDWPITYVVPTEQVPNYLNVLEPLRQKYSNLKLFGTGVKGIAATRKRIGEKAASLNEPFFMMLDDDLRFYVRKSPEVWNLRYVENYESADALDWCLQLLKEENVAAVGISSRQGNNRIEEPVTENMRLIRSLGFRTELFNKCVHGRVEVMEDFDVLLQLLRMGFKNKSLNYWAQGQKETQAAGGCSTYRTHELHENSARRLAELHPDFVRLRQKNNKTGGEFGKRLEVTISWKKAYDSSQKEIKNV